MRAVQVKNISVISVVVLTFMIISTCEVDENSWILDSNKASFGILIYDYTSEIFESGYLTEYPACASCDIDSIPLQMLYRSPGDFGSMGFKYSETSDTLFFGTIIWMGTGQIVKPNDMIDASGFEQIESISNEPLSIEYYHDGFYTDEDTYEPILESMWEHAKTMDLVGAFADRDFRVGWYLYPPTVGMFNPTEAKWILFLYSG